MTIEDKYGGIDGGNNGHDITSVGCCDDYAFNIILDIFGLNPLKIIRLNKNYNEALQQKINKYVFKLEQREYEREGTEQSFIS